MKNMIRASVLLAITNFSTVIFAQDNNTDVPPSALVVPEGADLRIISDAVNNQFPSANNVFVSVEEGSVYYGNLLATDPDGDILSFSLFTSASNGIVDVASDGRFTYTPNVNFAGEDQFLFSVDDGFGGSDTALVTVTVTAINKAPTANDDTALSTDEEVSATTEDLLANDTDPDGDALAISEVSASSGQVVDNGDGTVTYTPNADFFGTDTINVTISDGNGGTDTSVVAVTVVNVNDPPVASDDTVLQTSQDKEAVTGNVLANDIDADGDDLTVTSASSINGTVSINEDGTLTYTPDAGFSGEDTITYSISDGNGGESSAKVIVLVTNVNDDPIANDDAAITTDEEVSITTGNLLANDSDPDGDALTIITVSASSGQVVNNEDGTVTYTPNVDFFGTDILSVTVSDGNGGTATSTLAVTVRNINDDPIAVNDANLVVDQDAAGLTVNVLANDTDPDGDVLTVTAVSADNGSVKANADGTFTYSPNTGFVGADTITYTLSDGNDGTDTAVIMVTVEDINVAPSLSSETYELVESTVLSGSLVAFDSDGDLISYEIIESAQSGDFTLLENGQFDYTPTEGFVGEDSVVIRVSDGNDGSSDATLTFNVVPANADPIAVDDAALKTLQGESVSSGDLLANDEDPDGDSIALFFATAGNGDVEISESSVIYTPDAAFVGMDTVTYFIRDGKGGTARASFAIEVLPANAAPTISDQDYTVDENGQLAESIQASDLDGDALLYRLVEGVSNGDLSFSEDGSFTYQPDAGFIGVDQFTVEVEDTEGAISSATITLQVQDVNNAPVAVNDGTIEMSQDSVVTTNDLTENDTDADGDILTVVNAAVDYGSVTINSDNTFTYTPPAGFVGEVKLRYTVADGNGGTDSGLLVILVVGANTAPTVGNTEFVLNENQTLDGVITAEDQDDDPLTFALLSGPANGELMLSVDGNFSYAPTTGFVGVDTASIEVSDGQNGFARAEINFTVLNVNEPPQATNDGEFSTEEDVAVIIAGVLDNDTDLDGDQLILLSAVAARGTVVVRGSDLLYTPEENFTGTDTISYTVSDGNGGSDTAQVAVNVTSVNDAPRAVNDEGYVTPFEQPLVIDTLLKNDIDPDGDTLSILSVTVSNGEVSLSNDSVLYTPASGFSGTSEISYVVTDGILSDTGFAIVTTLPPNSPPSASDDLGFVVAAGDTLVLDSILDNDSDVDGDLFTIVEAVASAGTVEIRDASSLIFVIDKETSISAVEIVYTIQDESGQHDSATVTVEIIPDNFAPIANDDDPQTINQGDSITIDVLSNDSDADGDTLTVVSASATEGQAEVNSDGTLTYTSDGIFTGDDVVIYTIDDGRGARDSATVIVTILAVNEEPENEVPSANNDPALTTEFETPILNIDVLANDTDPDGSVLNVIQASAQYGQVQINSDNTLNYTPASGFSGADVVTYTISDGEGGRDSANFTVTVAAGAANAAPRALTDGPFNIGLEETQITFNVLLNDVDPDGDPIELLNASADKGKLTALPDGTIRYTKPVDFDGSDTVRYTISDGRGGIGNGKATITGPATIENRAPVAAPDGPFTVVEGGRAKDIDVLANDTDADGDRLTVISASASSGTATVSDDNTVDYVAAPGFVGAVTITYEISDGNGGSASSTATVNVVAAKATNTAPVASGATFKVTTDTTLVSLLPAATDAELDPVRYVMAIAPKDGIANVDGNGRFTYKPEAGFVGTDTFFFYVTDGQLNSRNYQVTLDIDGDSDGDGYLDSIDQCVNTDPGSKVDNTGCAIEEAEDFDGDGVSNENDNCPSTPAGQSVDANGCSDEQLEEAVEDFRDLEDDVQEVAQVTTVKEETKTLATTVNTGCNASISQGVSSGQQSSLGQACQTLKSGENTSEQVKEAVEEINYEEVSALSDNAIAANANQTKAVGNRMQVVNTGGGGGTVSVNGLNIRYGKQSIPTVALQEAVNAILGLAAGEGEEGDSFLDFGKLGIFIQGDLDFGDRDTQGNQTGYESDSWNLTIGGDYRFKDNLYGGLAFNFGETEVQYDTRGDESTIENWGMSFYGGWQITEAWYVDGLISYGNSDYSTLRNIEYTLNTGDFQATQRGDTTGTQLSYGINTGYMYSKNGFRFGPVLSFFYSDGTIDGFKEKAVKGSDAWAFDVGEQTIQSTRVSAGLQLDYSWLTDFGVIVPGIRAAYVREKEGSDDTITVRLANGDAFADGSSRFSIQNQKDDEGYYDISVNISGQFVMGVSGFVSYQFYQDYGGYTREGYSIGIRWDKPF